MPFPKPRFHKSVYEAEDNLLDISTLKPPLDIRFIEDWDQLDDLRYYFGQTKEFVLDYETNVVEGFYRRRARTFQIGDKNVQFVIDLLGLAGGCTRTLIHGQGGFRRDRSCHHEGLLKMYNEEQTEYELAPVNRKTFAPLVEILEPVFDSNKWLKIGQNLEFEYIVSRWCFGMRLWNLYDTMHMERLIYNGIKTVYYNHSLKDIFGRYFGKGLSKDEQKGFKLHGDLSDNQIYYAAFDLRAPWSVRTLQLRELEAALLIDNNRRAQNLPDTVMVENDAIPAFGDMHIYGLWINPTPWEANIEADYVLRDKVCGELDAMYGALLWGGKPIPKKITPVSEEELATAKAAMEFFDLPSPEELELRAKKKALTGKKGTAVAEERDALTASEKSLKETRLEAKARAKEHYMALKPLATKKYADEYSKYDGQLAINYSSADQVREVLLENFPETFTEKTLPNMDQGKTLPRFYTRRGTAIDVLKKGVEYKEVCTRLQSYGYRWITPSDQIAKDTNKKLGFVDPDTGRIHSRFLQLGTDTGRPSSTEPNCLVFPREDFIRNTIQSRPGYDMCANDCSGQELRILCDYSQEPVWKDAFENNKDIHSMSARMFDPELWDNNPLPNCAFFTKDFKKCKCPVHKATRDEKKAVTLGVIMGKMKWSLATEMGFMDREEEVYDDATGETTTIVVTAADQAGALIDKWFETFPRNKTAIDENQLTFYDAGEARTRGNRRRLIEKVDSRNSVQIGMDKYPVEKYPQAYVNAQEQIITDAKGKEKSVWTHNGIKESWVKKAVEGKIGNIMRQAGNVAYQGTAADMIKRSMGCGFDRNGEGYLWHKWRELEKKYGDFCVMLQLYPYDELVHEATEECSRLVGGVDDEDGVARGGMVADAIKRAGAEYVSIPMDSEGGVHKVWKK